MIWLFFHVDVDHDIETTGKVEQFNSGSINQETAIPVISTDTYAIGGNKGRSVVDQIDTAEEEESHINNMDPRYAEPEKLVSASEDHEFEEYSAAGKKLLKDHVDAHYNNEAPLNGNMILDARISEPSSKSGDELTPPVLVKDDFSLGATSIQYSEEKASRMCLQSEDIKHRVPRSAEIGLV